MVEAQIRLRKLAVKVKIICEMDIIVTVGGCCAFFPVREDNGEELRWANCAVDKNGLWRSRGYCAQTSFHKRTNIYSYSPSIAGTFKLRCNYLLISTKVSPNGQDLQKHTPFTQSTKPSSLIQSTKLLKVK